jgi:dTDP-glucose 4,6-dehydratase
MKIVVTGGAGFIGSALVRYAVAQNHEILTIDKLTYASCLKSLDEVSSSSMHHFLKADILDSTAVESAFSNFDPDAIIHLAAESHVDRSIDEPGVFVNGTVALLEAALRQWSRLDDTRREKFRFVHVSTDEVFGSLGASGAFSRESRYAPNSPYAASKAASDHFVRAYFETYKIPAIVTNCTNNYGPWQHSEKLIPTVIRHALGHTPIQPGETYLFGGRNEKKNSDVARRICGVLDKLRPRSDGKSYAE